MKPLLFYLAFIQILISTNLCFSQNIVVDTIGLTKTKKAVTIWSDGYFSLAKDASFTKFEKVVTDEYLNLTKLKVTIQKSVERLEDSKEKVDNSATLEEQINQLTNREKLVDKDLSNSKFILSNSILYSGTFKTKKGKWAKCSFLMVLDPNHKILSFSQLETTPKEKGDYILTK